MSFVKKLLEYRTDTICSLPNRKRARKFVMSALGFLFPHFSEKCFETEKEVEEGMLNLVCQLVDLLKPIESKLDGNIEELVKKIVNEFEKVHASLLLDAEAMFNRDPAAYSLDEIIITYPGFFAIACYRIANLLHINGIPILPRIMTEYAHEKTGIDIHPRAKIGKSFCIDHGTGVVIGETSQIGDNVTLYQGVTLGGLRVQKSMATSKRHPTIEDGVTIYSNATILGGDTVIGKGSIIGGNVWIIKSVPADSKVYYSKCD